MCCQNSYQLFFSLGTPNLTHTDLAFSAAAGVTRFPGSDMVRVTRFRRYSTIQTAITSMAHFATDMESRHSLCRSSFRVALGAPVANNWKHSRNRHRFQTNIEKVWTFKRWRRCWRCRCNPWCCGCCAQRGSMDQSHPPWKYWNTSIRWFQIDVLSPITKRWFPGGCLMLGDDGDPQSICYC